MNPNTNRSMLMGVVGGYLIYLAYELARDLIKGVPSQMSPALTMVVVILFGGIGAALLVYAWKLWKRGREGTEEDQVVIEAEDGDAAAVNEETEDE
mgnify:CR=1 FL=1